MVAPKYTQLQYFTEQSLRKMQNFPAGRLGLAGVPQLNQSLSIWLSVFLVLLASLQQSACLFQKVVHLFHGSKGPFVHLKCHCNDI